MSPRATGRTAAGFTDLTIIATAAELAAFIQAATTSGLLVYASAPTPMGDGDPRLRRFLRLRARTH